MNTKQFLKPSRVVVQQQIYDNLSERARQMKREANNLLVAANTELADIREACYKQLKEKTIRQYQRRAAVRIMKDAMTRVGYLTQIICHEGNSGPERVMQCHLTGELDSKVVALLHTSFPITYTKQQQRKLDLATEKRRACRVHADAVNARWAALLNDGAKGLVRHLNTLWLEEDPDLKQLVESLADRLQSTLEKNEIPNGDNAVRPN